ncbi:hypothetical protein VTH82DRAFT_6233 [Thermothelomyces myriococcoides]
MWIAKFEPDNVSLGKPKEKKAVVDGKETSSFDDAEEICNLLQEALDSRPPEAYDEACNAITKSAYQMKARLEVLLLGEGKRANDPIDSIKTALKIQTSDMAVRYFDELVEGFAECGRWEDIMRLVKTLGDKTPLADYEWSTTSLSLQRAARAGTAEDRELLKNLYRTHTPHRLYGASAAEVETLLWGARRPATCSPIILAKKFGESSDPKVKRFTLRQMEELVKQLQRRYGYELYPERAYLIRIPLALMRRRMGPTDQFYEELDDTFRRCLRALRDNQSNNDPYSFRMLAKTLRLAPGMDSKYSLGRRIYDVKTYPVQSPQGATILLYGHENGVTVVWRGGRALKPPKQSTSEKQNGANLENAVMVIDSDDETSSPAAFVDKPEFLDAPTTDAPVPEITQTLDLALGTAVLHVAVLPMPATSADDAAWNGADILKTKIIFAVTCATTDVYVITLPLTPPSHESKARPELRKNLLAGNAGTGVWGETLTLLTGPSRPCGGLAITLVRPKPGSRSRSTERPAGQAAQATRVIVAAHSREASGVLRLWDVALDAKPGNVNRVEPFQTEYLPSPLSSLAFNPTHTTQLLAVSSSQAARIYDYATAALPSDDTSEGPFPTQGSWLLSLYAPFARGPSMSTTRKPIVGAEWIANGRAILVLLADGQWGIWDIDGASPSAGGTGTGSLFSRATAGLRGSAITNFSVSGHLEGTKRLATVRGGIAVAQLAAQGTGPGEESAVLWIGGTDPVVSVIPVISRFWDSQLRRAAGGGVNLWSGAQPTRMIRLTDLGAGLLGERCTGAVAIPKTNQAVAAPTNGSSVAKEGNGNRSEGLPIEVLVQGESRLVVVHESEDAGSLTSRLLGARRKPRADLGPTRAILAYPSPDQPPSSNNVSFNVSFSQPRSRKTGGLFQTRPRPSSSSSSAKGASFDQSMNVLPSTEVPDETQSAPSSQQGLMFINDLSFAADQPNDELEVESRDIEQELRDVMEIDRELAQMSREWERGTKRVFFEED